MRMRQLIVQLPWLLLPLASVAAPMTPLRLATLEWRPFVASHLPGEGLTSRLVASAAALIDLRAEFDYLPWVRAMKLGADDVRYAGYFPAYYTEQRARTCNLSAAIGTSSVGLAYLKKTPVDWHTLADLQHVKIGVVLGYSNGKEFDAMVAAGALDVERSGTDLLNLKKLLAGRFRAIVIDRVVLQYLLLTDPTLAAQQSQIEFHPRPLAQLSMHICFQRTPAGRELQTAFDAALRQIDIPQFETAYFERLKTGLR